MNINKNLKLDLNNQNMGYNMKNEEKEILLNALCGYLPYGLNSAVVKFDDNDGSEYYTDCEILGIRRNRLVEFIRLQDDKEIGRSEWYDISWFKPYLRPMSSMTNEEKNEWVRLRVDVDKYIVGYEVVVDFYNRNHFDYRGLILDGLAMEAPEGMYD